MSIMYGLNTIKDAKGLHIAHLNVRSIMNKWDIFKTQFGDSNIHIFGISETWLNDSIPSNILNLSSSYTLLRNDRKWLQTNNSSIKKGGGVGLFINSKLIFNEEIYANHNCSSIDLECQWIAINQPHSKQLIIGNIYRPPQGNIEKFIEKMDFKLSSFNLDRVEIFVIGDFNIDMSDKNNANCKKLLDLIKPLGLRQIIKKATRPTNNNSSCIDLILTNSDMIENVGVMDISLSDHLPILCTRKHYKIPKVKCDFIGRSYRNYDAGLFQQYIREANWEKFENSFSVSEKWENFEKILKENIERMCPLKKFKIKLKKRTLDYK